MTGTDFNLATSILFVGYLTMQLTSNLLITRVRPSIYLGSVMTVWGVVCASQASIKSFGGLLAARIMVGVAEATFFPGATMLISSFYTRAELAHRIAWFYSGKPLANMFGGKLTLHTYPPFRYDVLTGLLKGSKLILIIQGLLPPEF